MISALKIWSQKQCQKMKNLLCLKNLMKTSSRHQKDDIFGKYEDKDNSLCDGSDKNKMDEDQHYSRKRASLILGICCLMELINAYKTL